MRWALIACGGAVLLAGCSDPKKASNANFAKAIDAYLVKNPLCVEAPLSSIRPSAQNAREGALPGYVAMPTRPSAQAIFDSDAKPFEALVKVGLLSAKPATIAVRPMFGNADQQVPVREYDLTDAGSKALAKPEPGRSLADQFCYGTPEVVEVTQFTEPTAAVGATLSSVNYTYRVKDRAPWSSDPAVVAAFPALSQTAGDKLEGRTELVLTNNGWVDSRGSRF